jgi:phospholipid/cholesterol/gamma-HCH transport system permease protein
MSEQAPGYRLQHGEDDESTLLLRGDWLQGRSPGEFAALRRELSGSGMASLVVDGEELGDWDSLLMAFLLQCHDVCQREEIRFDTRHLPEGVNRLLEVATAVAPHQRPAERRGSWLQSLHPVALVRSAIDDLVESLAFVGEVTTALVRMILGRANTRFTDFRTYVYQAGPDAFPIISLTSVLVGMILAYLGAVQLQQFGAGIYVADLVVIGMLREMGVLMAAIVMAGRTGAAYAAQLGTMQTNEEIDAITTMGISPMEFLVLPRMLALVAVMPLLTIYANVLGIVGGGIVAGGMGITPLQYFNAGMQAVSMTHISVGLIKSVVFATLIAVAGCRSGINSGRSSAAVGQAATEAVVTAVVYLIVADAAINILFQQLGV